MMESLTSEIWSNNLTKFKEYLAEKAQTNPKAYGKLVKDYEKAKELFREEEIPFSIQQQ